MSLFNICIEIPTAHALYIDCTAHAQQICREYCVCEYVYDDEGITFN